MIFSFKKLKMSSWEDDDEEVDSGYMSTSTFTLIMSYLIPLFFTSVFFWLAISIFRKPSASEQAETEYKRHERAASEAEASEGGMLQKVAKTVRRAIVGDGGEVEKKEKQTVKVPLR